VIQFDNVSKCFTTPARGAVWALRDVDLSCPPGELTCVLGPSGCGKTTLLRIAAGLETPTDGRVLVCDQPVSGAPEDIGVVSQEGDLLPWRRVLSNVALGLEIRGQGRRQRRRRAMEALHRLHLPVGVARSFPHELSGGMRQRVAIARALCTQPRILLMDEPFVSLDEPMRHKLQDDLLALWQQEPRTILFVTHSIEEAVFLADRIVILAGGRKVRELPVDLPRPRDRLSPPFAQLLLEIRKHVELAMG